MRKATINAIILNPDEIMPNGVALHYKWLNGRWIRPGVVPSDSTWGRSASWPIRFPSICRQDGRKTFHCAPGLVGFRTTMAESRTRSPRGRSTSVEQRMAITKLPSQAQGFLSRSWSSLHA